MLLAILHASMGSNIEKMRMLDFRLVQVAISTIAEEPLGKVERKTDRGQIDTVIDKPKRFVNATQSTLQSKSTPPPLSGLQVWLKTCSNCCSSEKSEPGTASSAELRADGCVGGRLLVWPPGAKAESLEGSTLGRTV